MSDDRQPPPRFNGARYCLEANARERGDKPALVMVGDEGRTETMTFGEIDRAVRSVAAGFRDLGLPPGARVMIRMGNDADYVITYFAALAAGLVAQPSSPQLTAGEAAFLMQDSGAAVIAAADECPLDPDACRGRIVLRRGDIAREPWIQLDAEANQDGDCGGDDERSNSSTHHSHLTDVIYCP